MYISYVCMCAFNIIYIYIYVGETFVSCVFVCGKQGNGRMGNIEQKCSVGPWALVGRALMGWALMGLAPVGTLGPYGLPGPFRAGPLWAT